jgi:hypothetical protein
MRNGHARANEARSTSERSARRLDLGDDLVQEERELQRELDSGSSRTTFEATGVDDPRLAAKLGGFVPDR